MERNFGFLSVFENGSSEAYLAKYLVKIEIPTEVAADADVSDLYDQYEESIAQFKVSIFVLPVNISVWLYIINLCRIAFF